MRNLDDLMSGVYAAGELTNSDIMRMEMELHRLADTNQVELHNQLYRLAAAVDYWLEDDYHLRARDGTLIDHFDQWLLAAERGEWP